MRRAVITFLFSTNDPKLFGRTPYRILAAVTFISFLAFRAQQISIYLYFSGSVLLLYTYRSYNIGLVRGTI